MTKDYKDGDTTIVDGKAMIRAKVWELGDILPDWSEPPFQDTDEDRKIEGYSGVIIDNWNKDTFTNGIRINKVKVKK